METDLSLMGTLFRVLVKILFEGLFHAAKIEQGNLISNEASPICA